MKKQKGHERAVADLEDASPSAYSNFFAHEKYHLSLAYLINLLEIDTIKSDF